MMTTFVERNNNILKSYKSVSTLFVKSSAKQTDVFFLHTMAVAVACVQEKLMVDIDNKMM